MGSDYIRRDAYNDLLYWKDNTDQVAFIEGARQVGKTFLVKKFCEENFKQVIYINLLEDTGDDFIFSLDHSKPVSSEKDLIEKALKFVNEDFVDNESTVVIIDEIQKTSRVYNKIRSFHIYFKSRFIVTGSYLGRTLYDSNYWESAGDSYYIDLLPINFREFLGAINDKYVYIFDNIDLHGKSDNKWYDILKRMFTIYVKIGGYPAVIKAMLKGIDLDKINVIIDKILVRFSEESGRYMGEEIYTRLIRHALDDIAVLLTNERKGLKNNDICKTIIELDTSIDKNDGKLFFKKKSLEKVIDWLITSNVIYECYKAPNCNLTYKIPSQRFYFNDTGLLYYLLKNSNIPEHIVEGVLYENYICEVLRQKRLLKSFAVFDNYELDFYLHFEDCNYGIEVKTGRDKGKSATVALQRKYIDKILYFKGDSKGGSTDTTETIPIYLAERYEFPVKGNATKKLEEDIAKALKGLDMFNEQ